MAIARTCKLSIMLAKRGPFDVALVTICCLFLITIIRKNSKDATLDSIYLPYQDDKNEYDIVERTADQVQMARKTQVIESCVRHAGQGVKKPMNPYFGSKFFPASITLAEEEKIRWCRIGKVLYVYD